MNTQLYRRPYVRTDLHWMIRILQLGPSATWWGQKTAYGSSVLAIVERTGAFGQYCAR